MRRVSHLENKLIYHPETLNTNYYDPQFWENKGIKGLTISKEITLDDIKEIAETSEIEISLIGHGHLNMFHSRRPLIENFFKYTKSEYDNITDNRNLRIIEEIRNECTNNLNLGSNYHIKALGTSEGPKLQKDGKFKLHYDVVPVTIYWDDIYG